MNTLKPTPKRMGLGISDEISRTMAAVREVARETNTPSLSHPNDAPSEPAAAPDASTPVNVHHLPPTTPPVKKVKGPKAAPVRRYSVDLPVYLIDEIIDEAHKQKIRKREFILKAFKTAGLTVKDVDMQKAASDE